MISAQQAADYFIAFSHEHGDPLSNLKLQKLLYYAQAWHLALRDEPLFPERIEAWVHGPVVPEVYRRYKEWAWQPITEDPPYPQVGPETLEHFNEIMDTYGMSTAYELERLTH
ncbi:MAG: type II toxin-antitoxin system antitoxin SocA domain-containing protein [bacterium]